MAKAPDPRQHARRKAVQEKATKPPSDDQIIVVVDGVRHVFDHHEMNALDVRDLRRATGMSLGKLLEALSDDPDIDIIAAIVWLSRRQHGEPKIKYELVVQQIGYDTDLDFSENDPDAAPADTDDAEDDASPEG